MVSRVGKFFYYTGAIHMHTTDSDGTKSFEEVIAIGQEVDLDFMMVSDHMTLSHRELGKEGYYGKTLVVVGYEHNDRQDHHHYLLFESPKVYPADMTAKQYVAAGAADNALGIMAHPDEIRNHLDEHPPYPWDDWTVEGFDGLELWNMMSEWVEKLTKYNKLVMCLSPRKSMVGPTDRILKKWDELNAQRKVCGIAGVDAHAFPIKVGPLTIEIFPYKVHFKCLRTYIILREELSTDFETARDQLYSAIRDCRLYFANIRWGEADDFLFTVRNSYGEISAGEEIKFEQGTILALKLPKKSKIKIIRDGAEYLTITADKLEHEIKEPGVYRVEVWRKRRAWIFSNHLRVTS